MIKLELSDDVAQRAKKIRLLIFDVDGVLTDGRLYFDDNGVESKAFHSRDGHGIKMLHGSGVELAIITGRQSDTVKYRMQNLGITLVHQGQSDKRLAYKALLEQLNLAPEEVAFMGDDVVDLPVMTQVGLAIATADAHPFVLEHCHWVTAKNGGAGAAREACEMLLNAQGKLDAMLQSYIAPNGNQR
ncbi:MAG: 3-deoxy-manno-octulosonate-8-phosphatase KdsC [Gammaproteobacteria bacterium]|nr:MAG: 3-deoxy-manno-octulosonate-8-phosphatase KdsC [Gammaproteobacteria bacterium]